MVRTKRQTLKLLSVNVSIYTEI